MLSRSQQTRHSYVVMELTERRPREVVAIALDRASRKTESETLTMAVPPDARTLDGRLCKSISLTWQKRLGILFINTVAPLVHYPTLLAIALQMWYILRDNLLDLRLTTTLLREFLL